MALKLGELATIFSANLQPLDEGIQDAKGKVQDSGESLKGAALKAGTLLGAGLAVGMTAEADKANAHLAAQIGATGPEAAKLGKIAGELYGENFGDSLEGVNEAVASVITSIDGMRDASNADVEAMTEKVLNFSTTFGVEVPRVAQLAGQAVRSGLVKNASQGLDLLTASMQKVPAAVREDLLDAVDEYGPFLAQIGIQGEQAFGLLVQGAQKGMYGIDKTGDALKEFTIRATDMSSATSGAYKALGLNQRQMTADLLAGGDKGKAAFDKIIGALKNMKDPVKQSQAALALFGTPLEDLSTGDIPKFIDSLSKGTTALGNTAGAADKMGDTLNNNASNSLETFKRKGQEALINMLTKAMPLIKGTFGLLSEHANIIAPIAVGLGAFAVAIWAVNAAMSAWATIQAIMNLEIWSCPITWIVAAIIVFIAIIVLIAVKTDWFGKLWGIIWGGIKAAAGAVASWFSGPFVNFFKSAWDKIKSWGNSTLGWFKDLPGNLKKALVKVADILTAPYRQAFNAIARLWNGTVGKLHFSVPGWVPGMGGKGWSMPNLPQLARGGTALAPGLAIVGEAGPELAYLGRGATVQPLSGGGASGGISILRVILQWPDGRVIKDQLIDAASLRGQGVGSYLGVANA